MTNEFPFRDQSLNVEERVSDLIGRLTLEEKFRLLYGYRAYNTAPIKRLGIPPFKMTDGPLGVAKHSCGFKNNTRFPTTIGVAATFNRELSYKMGEAVADETRATGRHMILAPGVNIDRTPLNGRTFEYYSEDPYLIKELAIPYIKGVQSKNIGTSLKHFAVNNQEIKRKRINAIVDTRTLHELYLRAFEEIVREADPWSVMTCYNRVNGVYGSENHYLLKENLIDKWNFSGFLVTDWGATKYLDDPVNCVNSLLSLEMPSPIVYKNEKLAQAYSEGRITDESLNELVRRILRVFVLTKLLDDPKTVSKGVRNTVEHQKLSQQIAEDGITLLKNDSVLPLDISSIDSIAVLGPNKDRKFGGLLYGGSSGVKPPKEITPFYALKKRCKDKVNIISDPAQADLVILFLGLNHDSEGGFWGLVRGKEEVTYGYDAENSDRKFLELPEDQIELIKETININPKTIVVLINGSPLAMDWINEVPVVIEAWYGGMHGGNAITNILFGDVNPSGKLPITFPKSLKDSPAHKSPDTYPGDLEKLEVKYEEGIYVGYRHFDKNNIEPLFPFGFGLSYTNFDLSNVSLSKNNLSDINDDFKLSVDVKNTGSVSGKEVIQVYSTDLESSVDRPPKELVSFGKIDLKPNDTRSIDLPIKARDLTFYDVNTNDWKLEKGRFKLLVGNSSRGTFLEKEIDY